MKIDIIRENPNVCATVIEDRGYIMGECSHKCRSIAIWGEMHQVDDLDEKKHGLKVLINHLEDDPCPRIEKIRSNEEIYRNTAILRLDIAKITGKDGT